MHISTHDANVFGTLALAVADRIRAEIADRVPMTGESAACVVAVATFARGQSIEQLSHVVGLSHSATVRLIDRLVTAGLVRRTTADDDRRTAALEPTAAGEHAASVILDARENTLRDVLLILSDEERLAYARANETMLAAMVGERASTSRICRLCDAIGCGHYDGRCPVTEASRS